MKELPTHESSSLNRPIANSVVSEALKWIDYPSRKFTDPQSGMDPEKGFDCSGFVKFVLERSGITVDKDIRYASNFFDKFGVFVHYGLHRKGDLIFFSDGIFPDHMGIVINKYEYIHSLGETNSRVIRSKIAPKPIKESSPLAIYNVNPIGFKRISVQNGRYQVFL